VVKIIESDGYYFRRVKHGTSCAESKARGPVPCSSILRCPGMRCNKEIREYAAVSYAILPGLGLPDRADAGKTIFSRNYPVTWLEYAYEASFCRSIPDLGAPVSRYPYPL
jgi:hypothetical protein